MRTAAESPEASRASGPCEKGSRLFARTGGICSDSLAFIAGRGALLAAACILAAPTFAQEAVRVTPEQAAQYAKYEALQQEAMKLKDQGQWREAADKVRQGILLVEGVLGPVNHQSLYAWEWVASLLTDHNDLPGAVDARQHALALADKLYASQPWLIVDAKLQLSHVERLAQLTPEQWKQYEEANQLWGQMMTHRRAGELNEAFTVGLKEVKLRSELLGIDDYYSSGDLLILGRIAYDGREFTTAQAIFEKYLEAVLSSCGEVHPRTADAYRWVGNALSEQGDYRESLSKQLKALKISRKVYAAEDPALVDGIRHTAQLYLELRDTAKARTLFEEILSLLERTAGVGSVEYAMTLADVASVNYFDNHFREARTGYELAIKTLAALPADTAGRDPNLCTVLNNFGSMCRDISDLERARALLTQALEICERTKAEEAPDLLPGILNQLGTLESEGGNWPAAFADKERALDLARRRWGDAHPKTLTILHEFGLLLRDAGYPAQARTNLETAFTGYLKTLGDKHEAVAKVISDLSQLYLELGDRAQAVEFGEKAVLAARLASGDDSELTATAYRRAAALLDPIKDFDAALEWSTKSLEVNRRLYGAESAQVATALGDLAGVQAAAGRLDDAIDSQSQAVAMRKQLAGAQSLSLYAPLCNLASYQQLHGDTKLSRDLYAEAAAIAQDKLPANHPDVSTCLIRLAASEAQLGNYQASWPLLKRATQLQDRMFAAQLPVLTASQMTGFVGALDDGVNVLLSLPKDVAPPDEVATCVLMTKARVLASLSRLKAAEGAMADDPQLRQYAGTLRRVRERYSRLVISPPTGWDADQLSEELVDAKRELSRAEKNVNVLSAALLGETPPVNLQNIRAELPSGAALVELVAFSPVDFNSSNKAFDFQPTRYVAFVIHADAKRPVQRFDLGETEAIDGIAAEVAAQVQAARIWYRGGRRLKDEKALEEEYLEPAKRLSAQLFAPLVAALGDVKQVYLAPAGDLIGLPFESLVDGDGKYLVESGYRFAYLVSGRDLLAPSAPPGRGTAIFSAPNYDLDAAERSRLASEPGGDDSARLANNERSPDTRGMSWESYPGFLAEGRNAAASFNRGDFAPVTTFTGNQALEESFKHLGHLRALVLVTHGYFLEKQTFKPSGALGVAVAQERGGASAAQGLGRLRRADNPLLRSGLILAGANCAADEDQTEPVRPDELLAKPAEVEDGWLTANEIAGLNLRGVQLVVLSACNSGREATGGGDAIAGLRTAFLTAGVRILVGSLFEVPDKETAEMMKPFYNAVAAGQSPLEALAAAEIEVIRSRREKHGAAHPFFWASFVVAGRP